MTAKLHKFDTAPEQDSATVPALATDASAADIPEDASAVTSTGTAPALRKWLIAANVAAWLVILLVIRAMFF